MGEDSRTPSGVGRIRALNRPRRIDVRCDGAGHPVAVCVPRPSLPYSMRQGAASRRVSGRWRRVVAVLDVWRIDDAWWRPQEVQRLYYRLVLETGGQVDIYRDLIGDAWYEQRYADTIQTRDRK